MLFFKYTSLSKLTSSTPFCVDLVYVPRSRDAPIKLFQTMVGSISSQDINTLFTVSSQNDESPKIEKLMQKYLSL